MPLAQIGGGLAIFVPDWMVEAERRTWAGGCDGRPEKMRLVSGRLARDFFVSRALGRIQKRASGRMGCAGLYDVFPIADYRAFETSTLKQ